MHISATDDSHSAHKSGARNVQVARQQVVCICCLLAANACTASVAHAHTERTQAQDAIVHLSRARSTAEFQQTNKQTIETNDDSILSL